MRSLLLLLCLADMNFSDQTYLSVPECQSQMNCFFITSCADGFPVPFTLDVVSGFTLNKLLSNCAALIKIRGYSSKHWLVSMESNDPSITSLELKRGETISCSVKDNKAVPFYSGTIAITAISASISPLKCVFEIRNDDEVLKGQQKATLSIQPSSVSCQGALSVIPTCEPGNAVSHASEQVVGGKTFRAVDVDMDKLKCPTGYTLKYGKLITVANQAQDLADLFSGSTMSCVEKNGAYVYQSDTDSSHTYNGQFSAHCEATTCEQCTYVPKGEVEIIEENGCKFLKCVNDGDMKIPDQSPKAGKAECTYLSDYKLHVWRIGGLTVLESEDVKCLTKKSCDESQISVICPMCGVGPGKLPNCTGDLTYDNGPALITCNEYTGLYQANAFVNLTEPSSLKCTATKGTVHDGSLFKANEGSVNVTVITLVAGAIIIVGIIAFVIVYVFTCKKKKKQPPPVVEPSMHTAVETRSTEQPGSKSGSRSRSETLATPKKPKTREDVLNDVMKLAHHFTKEYDTRDGIVTMLPFEFHVEEEVMAAAFRLKPKNEFDHIKYKCLLRMNAVLEALINYEEDLMGLIENVDRNVMDNDEFSKHKIPLPTTEVVESEGNCEEDDPTTEVDEQKPEEVTCLADEPDMVTGTLNVQENEEGTVTGVEDAVTDVTDVTGVTGVTGVTEATGAGGGEGAVIPATIPTIPTQVNAK